MQPAPTSSATIRWTARSVTPTRAATSRIRTSGAAARISRTWAWLVRKVHGRVAPAGEGLGGTAGSGDGPRGRGRWGGTADSYHGRRVRSTHNPFVRSEARIGC